MFKKLIRAMERSLMIILTAVVFGVCAEFLLGFLEFFFVGEVVFVTVIFVVLVLIHLTVEEYIDPL